VDWWFVADVSEQAIGTIFKGQAIQEQSALRKIPDEESFESPYFVTGKETLTRLFVCYRNGSVYK
jgi:hypothetical protein